MLTRILLRLFFCFTLLINSLTIYSQQHNTPPQVTGLTGDWSITYNAGLGLNTLGKAGHKISFETTYRETSSNEFVFSIASTKLPVGTYSRSSLLEISVGPRIYPFKYNIFFMEASLGAQFNSRQTEDYDWLLNEYYFYSSDPLAPFLFSVGAGVKLPVTKNNSMLIRFGYNTTLPSKDGVSYFSGMVGLSFNETKDTARTRKSESRFAFSAGGGLNTPFGVGYRAYSSKGLYSLEAAYLISRRTEIFLNGVISNMKNLRRNDSHTILGVTLGPRFYLNRSALSAFAELGGGIFVLTKEDNSRDNPIRSSISIGTGFTGNITEIIGMYVKGNLYLVLTDNRSVPTFSSVTGGLRFNL